MKKRGINSWLFAIVVGIIVFAAITNNRDSPDNDATSPPVTTASHETVQAEETPTDRAGENYRPTTLHYLEAWAAAQMKAKELMVSPSTAKFYGIATRNVTYIGCEQVANEWRYGFRVHAEVDCKNAFGVMMRYTMRCNVERRVGDSDEVRWFVSEVAFEE